MSSLQKLWDQYHLAVADRDLARQEELMRKIQSRKTTGVRKPPCGACGRRWI